ncbi:Ferri-bacillibactin esterase BesA [Thalassocella blandensis]|nr:Ferri-bacillibactin esterase BesA [Thalassocella blandensis]
MLKGSHYTKTLLATIIFPTLFLLASCTTPNKVTSNMHTPYLADTHSWLMQSRSNNLTYQISIALPENYRANETKYNVLYAVDANMEFGTLVETARNLRAMWMIEDLVIVGIGYNVKGGWNNVMPQRSLDLTPTVDQNWLNERNTHNLHHQLPEYMGTGGAEAFLSFISKELIPHIEKNYRVKQEGRALFGHSFGGLFATYALLQDTPVFERFIIGSPSLWWGKTDLQEGAIFLQEQRYASQNASLNAKVFLAVGALEESPEDVRFAMISNVEKLAATLQQRQYQELTLSTRIFANEHHMSVIPAQISYGLRAIYSNE